MLVRIHSSRKAYFCRKAKMCYPNEILAYLIGRQVHNGLIEVHWFYYPELKISTPKELECVKGSYRLAEQFAAEKDMVVVGDIHTHPDCPPLMSDDDHLDHKKSANKITAILEVPRKGRTKLAVWRDSPLPCDLEYF